MQPWKNFDEKALIKILFRKLFDTLTFDSYIFDSFNSVRGK